MQKTNNLIDLSQFEWNKEFYGQLNLITSIKGFNLDEIRERYLASRKKTGTPGSNTKRKNTTGGIAELTLENGSLKKENILTETTEPRGIALDSEKFAFSSENEVYIISNIKRKLYDPWFSYIHTIQFHPEENKLLISSSGFDAVFEYDLNGFQKNYEWFAWENGFNTGKDPETGEQFIITRNYNQKVHLENEGQNVLYIQNPEEDTLPTAKRAAFINSTFYLLSDPTTFLSTFFYEGKLYLIDRQSGNPQPIITGMKNPHGGQEITPEEYMATSTGTGEILVKKENRTFRYSLANLPYKHKAMEGVEWVQNTIYDHDKEVFIAIDSNRTSFVIFDPQKQLIDMIPYKDTWAIQDLVSGKLTANQKEILQN